ncbi:MAG TPA: A/G-specific adenine glycosylase, partial [Spirochaetia bacterium]|nr:A/G-specific adenine glycosylase [Spirochaetia bacterium]
SRVIRDRRGRIPRSEDQLAALPGIGPATARSICAFAFNRPTVFVETNIRAVFIHFFFPGAAVVTDAEILPLVEKTLNTENPREWYNALMDYGALLKKKRPGLSAQAAHYRKQTPFQGSRRQLRGAVLRLLTAEIGRRESSATAGGLTAWVMARRLGRNNAEVKSVCEELAGERLLVVRRGRYTLPGSGE